MSFATCCVCLELRSLPSAGVTRFPRGTYEPLRHPRAPGLSLTGVRLVTVISDLTTLLGLPVLRALSLVYVLPPVRCSDWASSSLSSRPAVSAFPRSCSRVGLHIDLSELARRSSVSRPHTCAVTYIDQLHRRLQPFRHLHDCSGCFLAGAVRRVGLATPLESACSRRT